MNAADQALRDTVNGILLIGLIPGRSHRVVPRKSAGTKLSSKHPNVLHAHHRQHVWGAPSTPAGGPNGSLGDGRHVESSVTAHRDGGTGSERPLAASGLLHRASLPKREIPEPTIIHTGSLPQDPTVCLRPRTCSTPPVAQSNTGAPYWHQHLWHAAALSAS